MLIRTYDDVIDYQTYFTLSLNYNCKECIEYFMNQIKVDGNLVRWTFREKYGDAQDPDIERVVVDAPLLLAYLNTGRDLAEFPAYLHQASREEVIKAYRNYLKENPKVIALFEERLA